jgi:tRNA1(Val) A37 N6-methylase TrmN6
MIVESEISEDAILGGALRVRQPLRGHRVGHDAILLAAATGGRAGEQAVELGTGVGAAGLAVAARIDGLRMTLVEIEEELCALAADNARLNRVDDRVKVINADAEDIATLAVAGLVPGGVDRVLMNPPFHDAQRQNVSPDPLRRLAHAGKPGLLARWVNTAAKLLKPHGVLTLIWRADGLDVVLDALRPAFGDVAVLPVHPRADAPAIRVLVRAVKAGGSLRINYPVLVLNNEQGKPTAEAEAALRSGKALKIAES